MKERPILFSGPMVRALLAGAKTQTRRLVRPQPKGRLNPWTDASEPGDVYVDGRVPVMCVESRGRNKRDAGELSLLPVESPYGDPGDRLWVRETWLYVGPGSGSDLPEYVAERADPKNHKGEHCWYRGDPSWDQGDPSSLRWTPSIFMPRWASRLTLEVTDVRVQRLQDITEEDATAEGVAPQFKRKAHGPHQQAFMELWDSLNAKRATWDSNPWVWAVTFRRIE